MQRGRRLSGRLVDDHDLWSLEHDAQRRSWRRDGRRIGDLGDVDAKLVSARNRSTLRGPSPLTRTAPRLDPRATHALG